MIDGVGVAEAGRDDVDWGAGQQQGRGMDVSQVVKPGVWQPVVRVLVGEDSFT